MLYHTGRKPASRNHLDVQLRSTDVPTAFASSNGAPRELGLISIPAGELRAASRGERQDSHELQGDQGAKHPDKRVACPGCWPSFWGNHESNDSTRGAGRPSGPADFQAVGFASCLCGHWRLDLCGARGRVVEMLPQEDPCRCAGQDSSRLPVPWKTHWTHGRLPMPEPHMTPSKPSVGGECQPVAAKLWGQPPGRDNGKEDLEMSHGEQETDTRYLLMILNLPLWGIEEAQPHSTDRPWVPEGHWIPLLPSFKSGLLSGIS